jgi:hypothetical protein
VLLQYLLRYVHDIIFYEDLHDDEYVIEEQYAGIAGSAEIAVYAGIGLAVVS